MPVNTFADDEVIDAARQNANWALAVLTDTARTITVTHTWNASQTFASGWTAAAACTITVASATAFAVGLAGATNPAFQVDASTASSATGIKVKSAAAAGGVALSVISSGTNENVTFDAKGSGTITLGGTSTGAIVVTRLLTLSSGQIGFPATQSASADANTLDDYEEGSWTPAVGGTATYTTQWGRYVKVGKFVTAWCNFRINAIGSGSATTISGLPYAAANVSNNFPGCVSYWISLQAAIFSIGAEVVTNTSTVVFNCLTTAASNTIDGVAYAVFGNSAGVRFCVTYEAAA